MKDFSHPNVLSLIGVSLDVGQSPYIVMPYMANGSLLNYLRKERPNLTVDTKAPEEMVHTSWLACMLLVYVIAWLGVVFIPNFTPNHAIAD